MLWEVNYSDTIQVTRPWSINPWFIHHVQIVPNLYELMLPRLISNIYVVLDRLEIITQLEITTVCMDFNDYN